jgi:hypothetical protein
MNSGPPLEEPALRAPPASLSELPSDGEASALSGPVDVRGVVAPLVPAFVAAVSSPLLRWVASPS